MNSVGSLVISARYAAGAVVDLDVRLERPEVARERAESIAQTLRRLLPGLTVETKWETGAQPTNDPDADSVPGQSQRRAEIRAVF